MNFGNSTHRNGKNFGHCGMLETVDTGMSRTVNREREKRRRGREKVKDVE